MSETTAGFVAALAPRLRFSFVTELVADPEQNQNVPNKRSRQVRSGHYVDVAPTPLPQPLYVGHSHLLLEELGLPESSPQEADFLRIFSGDMSPLAAVDAYRTTRSGLGWATGYALSIYGQEYYSNCPFKTGNGYGDGRAMSIFEVDVASKTYRGGNTNARTSGPLAFPVLEFQLKGGGQTPYCRGGDGRAVLRSSVREFLVSEAMHVLGIPTSRSLSLIVSASERVMRPWYSNASQSEDPDTMISESVATATRVAPSFVRVGQLELFARRERKNEHPRAKAELEALVQHLVRREYPALLFAPTGGAATPTDWQSVYLQLASAFADRLAALVAGWVRVGYCQGNFNADNCAAGGWTLDYGPFGFVEAYTPSFQMWVGGGDHFSFMNQPTAAAMNFKMFCMSLVPLLDSDDAKSNLTSTLRQFPAIMQREMEVVLAAKMGTAAFHSKLWQELDSLLQHDKAQADWTLFWRHLSELPRDAEKLFRDVTYYELEATPVEIERLISRWAGWLEQWHGVLVADGREPAAVSAAMKAVNPKFIPREWMLKHAYDAAGSEAQRSFREIHELQSLFADPYGEQSEERTAAFYKKKPLDLFGVGGVSHCSCSS